MQYLNLLGNLKEIGSLVEIIPLLIFGCLIRMYSYGKTQYEEMLLRIQCKVIYQSL